MTATVVQCLVLVGVLAAAALSAASPLGLDKARSVIRSKGYDDFVRPLSSKLAASVGGFDDEEHSKLELTLRTQLLLFRDALTQPQPKYGLPALDPFDFTGTKPYVIANDNVNLKVTPEKIYSRGVSKFKVEKLSLYLVELMGVLDLTLPDLSLEVVIDIPKDSWVSPLKVHVDNKLRLRFYSPEIKLGVRGQVSVANARLSLKSTKISLDLGDWGFVMSCENEGMCKRNVGLESMLAGLLRSMTPQLIEDWLPVGERMITKVLDDKLQELKFDDLMPFINE